MVLKQKQLGGTLAGVLIGIILALSASLIIAMYINKMSLSFLLPKSKSKNDSEMMATPVTPPPSTQTTATQQPTSTDASTNLGETVNAQSGMDAVPAVMKAQTSEALGYFVQIGAFSTLNEAEATRANAILAGHEARITEKEMNNGETLYRLRVGPFDNIEDATAKGDALSQSGFPIALVLVKPRQ